MTLQFTANKEDLAIISNLTRATGNVGAQTNIKLEATSKDLLTLTTSNGSLLMQAKVKAINAQGDAITMNAKKLSDIILRINGNINFDNGVIKFGKSKLTIPTMVSTEIVSMTPPEGDIITINSKELVNQLRKTIYATSTDISNLLGGVSINVNEVVAIDGNMMAINKLSTDILKEQIVIPKILAEEIIKNFADSDIDIIIGKNKIMISNDKLTIVSGILEGIYPKYNQLIPKSFENEVSINKIELLQALDILSLVKDDKTNLCKFEFTSNSLIISAHNAGSGEGQSEIEIEYNGEDLTTGFNIEYLKNVLKNTDGDVVTIGINGALSAFAFKSGDDDINILMPIQLRS